MLAAPAIWLPPKLQPCNPALTHFSNCLRTKAASGDIYNIVDKPAIAANRSRPGGRGGRLLHGSISLCRLRLDKTQTYICTCVRLNICECTRMRTHVHARKHAHTHTQTHTLCTYTSTHYTYTHIWRAHTYPLTHTYSAHTHVHTHTHTHTHKHAHSRAHTHSHIHTRTHAAHICTHMHRHICINTHMLTHKRAHTHVHTHKYIHMCAHAYMRTCLQAHPYTHLHTYSRIHVHMYTQLHTHTHCAHTLHARTVCAHRNMPNRIKMHVLHAQMLICTFAFTHTRVCARAYFATLSTTNAHVFAQSALSCVLLVTFRSRYITAGQAAAPWAILPSYPWAICAEGLCARCKCAHALWLAWVSFAAHPDTCVLHLASV